MSHISELERATRRRRPPGLLVFLAFLVVGLVIASAVVDRIDASALAPRIEAGFARATGRTLIIAGRVNVSLLPAPGIVARDVSIANRPGGSRPVMAHADEVGARVDLFALLAGEIHVRSVTLKNPDILFERDADGRGNWIFERPVVQGPGIDHHAVEPLPGTAAPAAAPVPAASHRRFALRISNLDISGGRLVWNDPGRLGTGAIAIDTLHAQQHDDSSSFTLELAGRRGPAPFNLSLASGPPESLASADAEHPFPLRATLTLGKGDGGDGDDVVVVDGALSDPLHGRGFKGVVRASLPHLAQENALFPHADLPIAEQLELHAHVAETADGHWSVSSLRARGGHADLDRLLHGLSIARFSIVAPDATAPIAVDAAGALRGTPIALRARSLGTLDTWRAGSGRAPVDASLGIGASTLSFQGEAARSAAGMVSASGTLRAETPDPGALAALFGHRLDRHSALGLAGKLQATRDPGGAVTATLDDASIRAGGAALPPSRLSLGYQPGDALSIEAALAGEAPWLRARVALDADPANVSIALDGHDLPAAGLVALIAGAPGIGGRLDLSGTLTAQAQHGRIDVATLNGPIRATLVDGSIDQEELRTLIGPALEAAHLPVRINGSQRVRCAGASGAFSAGRLALASLSLDSALLTLDGGGVIDVGTRTLALSLRPAVRASGATATASVDLGGSFDAPRATLARDQNGRVGFSLGGSDAIPAPACDSDPAVAALPPAKAPKPIDILRSLGILR